MIIQLSRPLAATALAAAALQLVLSFAAVPAGAETPEKLLGSVTETQLEQAPFAEWFTSGYTHYHPDADVVEALRGQALDELEFTVFFGTWCGDSRREVPRLLKLLDTLGVADSAVELIAVDNTDTLHKRSPNGEEEGFEIYRVPTVMVSHGGDEVARLVEHPVRSLERDLLAILDGGSYQDGDAYQPSYPTYPVLRRWLQDGLLVDPNVSADGLAQQVRHLASSESEIYSAARVLLLRGDVVEAVKLSEVNASLFWDSATTHARLAAAQLQAGSSTDARTSALRALQRSDDADQIEELLELVERAATGPVSLPADRISALEVELRDAEAAFAAAFASGDMEAFATFLAEGVVFMAGDQPLRGPEAVLERWTPLRGEGPEPPFTWRPERVAVEASGQRGLSTGPVFLPDGTWTSSFVSTWTHTPAGWRVLLDIGPRCPH